jgi:hypothetical protein
MEHGLRKVDTRLSRELQLETSRRITQRRNLLRLQEARAVIEGRRRHYNTLRPHSSFGYKPPDPEAVLWPASQSGSASPITPTRMWFKKIYQPRRYKLPLPLVQKLGVQRQERDMKYLVITALLLSSVSAFADDNPSTYTPPQPHYQSTLNPNGTPVRTTPYNPSLGNTGSGSGGYTGETYCNGRASVNGKC